MGHKNAFLKRMQANHEREAKTGIMLAEKWTRQAACDALVLLLGYGACMGRTKWGKKRILRAVEEWTELFLWVLKGLQGALAADTVTGKLLKGVGAEGKTGSRKGGSA